MNHPDHSIYEQSFDFDESNKIHPTAIIYPNVTIGQNNIIGAYCVIGSNGEIRGMQEFEGRVEIGSGNTISELVTIQRPAAADKKTIIGNDNIIMAHTHIGHDAVIGNNCELSTGTIVGGYCHINDGAKIKLGVTIRNRKIIGREAVVGMGAVVTKDVEPGLTVVGNPAKILIK
jgi:UDP-N-acetylglucosamine acyltransferase